jgi:hypothetical protein
MSIPIPMQTAPTAAGVFQSHFGTLPGSQDAKKECENWQRLCDELLAERAKLRFELEKARLEQIFREWDAEPVPTWEEAQALIDRSTTFEQLIEEIERDAEKES